LSVSDVQPITQNFARPSYRPAEPSGMDPEMRRMAVVAACFGGAMALAIGAFSLSGPPRTHAVPVIEPPAKPVRVKPEHPGGMTVVGADDFAAAGTEKLSPPAEKPAIRALRAKKFEKAAPVVTKAKPPVPEKPVVAAAAPVAEAPALRLPTVQTPTPALSGAAVQLAAFESQQAAEQDWGKMAEKMPAMFNGHTPVVERARVAGRTVYRLRTGGFASLSAATAFCKGIREKGGDCSIAAF